MNKKIEKIIKFASAGLMLGLAVVGLSACSSNKNNNASDAKIPTKISKKTTITFWHGMHGAQQKELVKLTKEFEKENPNIKVNLQDQGSYIDLQAKLNSTLQSPKNLPTITQAYPGWLYNASKNNMLVDLTPYMANKNVGWGNADNSHIRKELLDGAKINGKQYGLPFNKSIEVLVYNKTLFDKYGIKNAPKTMDELKQDAKIIYEKSNHKVVGAGFDSLANYYTLGMKDEGVDFNNKIDFTGATSKKVINYYADGMKEGYFRITGSEHYLSAPFDNQKVAMFIGTSAGESFVKLGVGNKFDYEVAPRPGKYTMQQGTDIYMFNQATDMQKASAFKYMKFLTSKKTQLEWANVTGYIPVNEDVVNDKAYTQNAKTKLPAKLSDAMKNLYSVPVDKNSDSAYNQLNSILQNVLISAQKKQNVNSQIQAGKTKFDSAWKQ